MPVLLAEPKRIAIQELAPGNRLREMLLCLPDRLEEVQFDLISPVLCSFARAREDR